MSKIKRSKRKEKIIFHNLEVINKIFNITSIFPDYPKQLVHLVFFPDTYNNYNYDYDLFFGINSQNLEFLGDRVLKLIHGETVFRKGGSSKLFTDRINILESNATMIKYMKMGIGDRSIDMCKFLKIPYGKVCADRFESFIGSLYYYYKFVKHDVNIIEKILQWLNENTVFNDHVSNIDDTNFFDKLTIKSRSKKSKTKSRSNKSRTRKSRTESEKNVISMIS